MKCKCGSYAINHNAHGRDGTDPDLCDVCYWRVRAEIRLKKIKELERKLHHLKDGEPRELVEIIDKNK